MTESLHFGDNFRLVALNCQAESIVVCYELHLSSYVWL